MTTIVRLSWTDRTHILLGWDVMVVIVTPTVEVVDVDRSESSVWCAPPSWWPKRKQESFMTAEPDPDFVLVQEIMER